MNAITVSRAVDAPREDVLELVEDAGPFMRSAGFDEVEIDESTLSIRNSVGVATIELDCELVEDDAVLAYEQRDGIFESMETRYVLDDHEDGTEITATTEFAVDVALVGELLDATVIKRQRRKELEAQFDYLEAELADA